MMSVCIFLVLFGEDDGVITAEVGQTVTFKCFCGDDSVTILSWYQQSLGSKPIIISTRMRYSKEASIYPAYKERFQVESGERINHLKISRLRIRWSLDKECSFMVYQAELEVLRAGDSVNLSCAVYIYIVYTVYSEKCAGPQSLFWFRHGAAQPVIMYQNMGDCANNDSHTKNCTLNYPIQSVNSSDAGMNHCGLASCGNIVFGNGTRVVITRSNKLTYLLLGCLSVGFVLSIILILVLAFIVYKLKKQICPNCKGTVSYLISSAVSESHDEDSLHYVALDLSRTSQRQEESVESICVYSRVKSRKE
uniref:Ig-like domain-containing protein n=1 Tax=Mola mola TaxID=94237 RepID=A0A3Q3WGS1_MOLML